MGTANKVYKATPAADPVRCCPECHHKLMQAFQPETVSELVTIGDQLTPLIKGLSARVDELMAGGLGYDKAAKTARNELMAKAAELGYTEEQVKNCRWR